jgi:Protein of unknown function (DUF1559)
MAAVPRRGGGVSYLRQAGSHAGDDAADKKARTEALGRMRTVANAFWKHFEEYKLFPAAALADKKGQLLLSWRVLILPYIGEEKLFREFRLEEPWDSAHNKTLLAKMPHVYAPVRGEAKPGLTPLQVFTGPGTIFEGTKPCRPIADIQDGTSNTILVVEAAELVPWTKPADLAYDAKKPLPKLGFAFPKVFLFATADGAQYVGKREFDEKTLRLAITRSDGMSLDLGRLLAEP